MKRRPTLLRILSMLKTILIPLLLIAPGLLAPGPQQPADKHPVEGVFMSGIAAFNAHDLDEFMKQFASDVDMYTPTGWLRGQQSVRERFAQTFKQFPSVRMEIEDLRTRDVAPGTVITDFRWRVYPMGKGPAYHGVGSGVYVRRDGVWVEVLEHETVTKVDEGLAPSKK
jgi:uncharacterized protein (TIGR02246 family)